MMTPRCRLMSVLLLPAAWAPRPACAQGPAGVADPLPELLRQLGDDNFAVREAATHTVEALAEADIAPVCRALARAEDPEVRARLSRVVAACAPGAEA